MQIGVDMVTINGVAYVEVKGRYFSGNDLRTYRTAPYQPHQPLGMKKRPHWTVTAVVRHPDIVIFKSDLVASSDHFGPQIIGWVYKTDIEDPFFWEAPLDPDWVRDLMAMAFTGKRFSNGIILPDESIE
jgi:hypothetical protein